MHVQMKLRALFVLKNVVLLLFLMTVETAITFRTITM